MKTTSIGAFEARRNFGRLLTDVGYKGTSIVVEKNREELAAIVPIKVLKDWQRSRQEIFDEIRAIQNEVNLSPEEAERKVAEAVHVIRSQQEQ